MINTKRLFDLTLIPICFFILFLPFVLTTIFVFLTSPGPLFYWSDRVGRKNILFKMPKFRSMQIGTPEVATHILNNRQEYFTPIGSFIRKTSLDELPQLYSILKGDMSFVGPRPALFNQYDLIKQRSEKGIDRLMPGLTGWAQINGRDNLSESEKIKFDEEYMKKRTFLFDLKILYLTFIKIIRREL